MNYKKILLKRLERYEYYIKSNRPIMASGYSKSLTNWYEQMLEEFTNKDELLPIMKSIRKKGKLDIEAFRHNINVLYPEK